MHAILNIEPNEVDERLLTVIKELLARNVDVTLRNHEFELQEFDDSIPLDEVMKQFQSAGYGDDFLKDLRVGFETSEIYSS